MSGQCEQQEHQEHAGLRATCTAQGSAPRTIRGSARTAAYNCAIWRAPGCNGSWKRPASCSTGASPSPSRCSVWCRYAHHVRSWCTRWSPYRDVASRSPRSPYCWRAAKRSWLCYGPRLTSWTNGRSSHWFWTRWRTTTGRLSNAPRSNAANERPGGVKQTLAESRWSRRSRARCPAVQVHPKRTQCCQHASQYSTTPPRETSFFLVPACVQLVPSSFPTPKCYIASTLRVTTSVNQCACYCCTL